MRDQLLTVWVPLGLMAAALLVLLPQTSEYVVRGVMALYYGR